MQRYLFLFFIFLSTGSVLAAETRGVTVVAKDPGTGRQAKAKLYNKTYAVIIGIDRYENLPRDRQLQNAVSDASGVQQVLSKGYLFDKIIMLQNEEATKERIMRLLTSELPREMGKEDALFVFWAGHGNQEKSDYGDLGYLIPYDGSTDEIYRNITMAEIRDTISKKLPAKHVFYAFDACYSGLLTTRRVDGASRRDLGYLKEITREPVRQVLTAGGKGEEALDGGPKGHSVFTGRLIEALENAEDFITANELQVALRERVSSDARGRGHTQTPAFGPLYGMGDFVFIPKPKDKLGDLTGVSAARKRELDDLKKAEAEMTAAKMQEQQEIARKQAELDSLDKQIAEMKERLGTGTERTGDSMDQLLALAEQKEQQGQHLEELRRQREAEELKRQQEIMRLQSEADEKRLGRIEADLAKYRKIATSKYAQDMKPAAWKALVASYPEAKDVPQYDEKAFREAMELGSVTGKQVPVDSLTENQKTLHAVGLIMAKQLSVFKLTFPELRIVVKGLMDGYSGKKPIVDADSYSAKIQALARSRSDSTNEPRRISVASASGRSVIEADDQKTLYAVGVVMSRQISVFDFTSDEVEIVKQGLTDGMSGKAPLTDMDSLKKKVQDLATSRNAARGNKLAAKTNDFLAAAASERGAIKTDSGLIYISLRDGNGVSPTSSDKVKVNYRGTLIDGKEFDSSYKRGQPNEFPLNGVIKCWTEGVQMMKTGGKARLICPPEIAYGETGAGAVIPPKATLIFEVELLEVKR